MDASLVMGTISLVGGLGLRYWINRRKFYRRSATGSEGFSSYEKSVIITFIERLGKWVAYLLIIFGVLFFLVYRSEQKKKKKTNQAITLNMPVNKRPYFNEGYSLCHYTAFPAKTQEMSPTNT